MSPQRFLFRWAPEYRRAAAIFTVTPARSVAVVDEGCLDVRFGPWHLRTGLDNVADVAVTGPYRFYRTAGPARLGFSDRGLTFATNGERGVRVRFIEKVAGIEPTGWLTHPELTLTVADIDRFVRVLARPG